MAELDAYYEEIRPRLHACDEAKQALRLTLPVRIESARTADADGGRYGR
jgi:hypothetical protein